MSKYEIKCSLPNCNNLIFEVSCYMYDNIEWHYDAVCMFCYDKKTVNIIGVEL